MFLLQLFIPFLLSVSSLANDCLKIKTGKETYSSKDKVLTWTIDNGCNKTRFYLISIEIKTDTGWKVLNPYVHSLMRKDVISILSTDAGKRTKDQVEIGRIIKEKDHQHLNKLFIEYRLSVSEYEKRDFASESSRNPSFAYFKLIE
jgi:hypothetical protein